MIQPMIRYGFLLYHSDVKPFLERLRELGVVDITTTAWVANDSEKALIEKIARYQSTYKHLKSVKAEGEPFASVEEAVVVYEDSTAEYTTLDNSILKCEREKEEIAIWGEFDPQTIERLEKQGLRLRFFEISNKGFDPQWQIDYPIEIVAKDDANVYFVLVYNQNDPEARADIPAIEIKAPQESQSQKQAEIEQMIARQVELQKIIARTAQSRSQIEAEYCRLSEKLDLSRIMHSGEEYADGTVQILEGWSLVPDRLAIEEFARGEDVIFTTEKAQAEQNPPIKLKNGFFTRLYEPIGKLYMLPRYDELDMTPFFAPFFMIFFGMCLGDAGYGLLFIAAIIAMWKKIPVKFRDFAWLGIFLSFSGVIFGLLTGNMFGVELPKLAMFASIKEYFLGPNSMFYLAIAVGAMQVLFGQILRIFNRSKRGGSFVYGLSSVGWVVLMISSMVAYLGMDGYTTSSLAYYITLGISGVLILFFSSPKKGIFVNFGSGLYSCYEMATGIIGDLISYVRLFAIGLAGAIIAQVFNELAMGLSGDIPVIKQIVMLIILVIGHGLTIFVSVLGAFVHPVRLTFVEFFKNAEFHGGGREFTPFRKVENQE